MPLPNPFGISPVYPTPDIKCPQVRTGQEAKQSQYSEALRDNLANAFVSVYTITV